MRFKERHLQTASPTSLLELNYVPSNLSKIVPSLVRSQIKHVGSKQDTEIKEDKEHELS